MEKTVFIKEGPDNKGRIYIIEGIGKPNNIFSVKRFICQVQPQENEHETQEVIDMILKALNK